MAIFGNILAQKCGVFGGTRKKKAAKEAKEAKRGRTFFSFVRPFSMVMGTVLPGKNFSGKMVADRRAQGLVVKTQILRCEMERFKS